jgi:hypothetical protein
MSSAALIARFARCGYTLRRVADGYELAGYSPPAVFNTADAAAAWIERREAERGRVGKDAGQMELWEKAA